MVTQSTAQLERLRALPEIIEQALRAAIVVALRRRSTGAAFPNGTTLLTIALARFDASLHGASLGSAQRMQARNRIDAGIQRFMRSRLAVRLLRLAPSRIVACGTGVIDAIVLDRQGRRYAVRFTAGDDVLAQVQLARLAARAGNASEALVFSFATGRTRRYRVSPSLAA